MAKAGSKKSGKSPRPKVLSSELVFDGPIFKVCTDRVLEPSGITCRRDIIRHPGSVVILAIDRSQTEPRVLLERQYRYVAKREIWELPAGRIDPGESALSAAKRELLEETGYNARRWTRAFTFYASPGFLDETMSLFLAEKLTRGEAQPEEDEVIATRLVPWSEAVQWVLSGKVMDAKTIAGVLWFERRHLVRQAHGAKATKKMAAQTGKIPSNQKGKAKR